LCPVTPCPKELDAKLASTPARKDRREFTGAFRDTKTESSSPFPWLQAPRIVQKKGENETKA
jgi:hypothetical protein